MPSGQCSHCGSTEIDRDPSRGDAVCMNCGSILEESIIVSEVQYAQDCSGATRAVGQLVSADGNIPTGFNLGHGYGLGKESRVITLQNARRKITNLAMQLKLPERFIDIAHNFYKMALGKKLTQGRKNTHVIAACVYMVCRKEGTAHMLLDLSDILQVNVYELGKTYLKLSTALCINIPAIDPSLYIMRFAHQLEFGDKTQAVTVTASRLVQRMKRDWMHTGRRPSGLCGAALLVAARLHNFCRSVDDVIRVVRVCQATVRKRLTEFSETPSSRLTLDEFMTIDLEEEQDPPAFKAARQKKSVELEDESKVQEATKQVSKFQSVIEKALEEARQKKFARYSKYAKEGQTPAADSPDGAVTEQFIVSNTIQSINEVLQTVDDIKDADKTSTELEKLLSPIASTSSDSGIGTESLSSSLDVTLRDSPTASQITEDNDGDEEINELDITGLDDDELDAYIMDDEETKSKTAFWFKTNKDYLQEQKEKEEKRLKEEAENANKEQKKKRKRPPRTKIQANTTEEAIEKMLQQKKISLKLDYTVLENLNSENATSTANRNTPAESEITEQRPVKRIKSSKPKATFAPLPSTIRKGISDIIGSVRNNSSNLQKDTETEKDYGIKETTPSEEKVIPSTSKNPMLDSSVNHEADEDLEDEDFDEEEEEEDNVQNDNMHLSAAQLLSRHRGEEEETQFGEYSYYEDYEY